MFLFFVLFTSTHAQLSKKHFIPPLTYAESGNANPENQFLYISTPSNQSVSYTIKQIGSPGSDITGLVSSSSPQEIFINSGDSQLFVDSRQTSVVHSDKGFIIEADDVIYVSVRVLAGGSAQAGALVSKGASALGKIFRAGSFTNENPEPNTNNYLNFISIMASENNTTVTFSDMPAGISKLVNVKSLNWNYNTEPEPGLNNRSIYWPRGKVLGGSSSINAMCYCRGHKNDYDSFKHILVEPLLFDVVSPVILALKSVRMFWGKSLVSIYNMTGKWTAYWRDDGKPCSAEFDTEQDAIDFAKKKKTELAFEAKCYMKNLSQLGKYKVKNGN